jgi:hypothetical protein
MALLQAMSDNEQPLMRLGPFGGIDLSVTPSQVDQNHSPDMLNFHIDERGALTKRTGYERVYATSLGAGAINGMFEYRKKDGTVQFLLAHGTKLYKQSWTSQPVQIYSGLANQSVNFFSMKDKCYIMDGVNYLVYDGTTVKEVEPYVPTLSVSKLPSGGGTHLEDFNLLGTAFKESFSSDGTSNDYFLSLKGLDATEVTILANGVEYKEGYEFVVDRKSGKVSFYTVPPAGTNNVIITAHKTYGDSRTEYFTGNGINKIFNLSLQELDRIPAVEVWTDNGSQIIQKVEGTDYTVDYEKGQVRFLINIQTSENVIGIKSYKKLANFKNQIKKNWFHVFYGGSNDTRVFISGNPDFPNHMWRSGLYDPSYFPENGFYKIGSDSDKIQGFSKQYDYLVIHKEFSLWNMQYEINNGEVSFPIKPINDQVGTLAKGSIQIIENNPVSLSKDGIYALVSSNVRDERNIQYISDRIDKSLLKEINLKNAISIDFDKKYWLAVNGNVYIYDYVTSEWFVYDNIHASSFIERNGVLHFASSIDGLLYRFKDRDHVTAYDDDGQPINAYWVSKLFDFGLPEYQKAIQKLFVNMKPGIHTSVDVHYRTDRKGETFAFATRMDKLDFESLDFTRFGFRTSDIPQESGKKVKIKKANYLQLKLVNDQIDEGLSIDNLSIKYSLMNEVKS